MLWPRVIFLLIIKSRKHRCFRDEIYVRGRYEKVKQIICKLLANIYHIFYMMRDCMRVMAIHPREKSLTYMNIIRLS